MNAIAITHIFGMDPQRQKTSPKHNFGRVRIDVYERCFGGCGRNKVPALRGITVRLAQKMFPSDRESLKTLRAINSAVRDGRT